MFNDVYKNKKVLVTGHTGFKGSWLTMWLLKLGARICGISDRIPTSPSLFEDLDLVSSIEHHICDVNDRSQLQIIVESFEPDFVFHLAAESLVSEAYTDPLKTLRVNVLGTACVLDVLRACNRKCVAIVITSDKCYENFEWVWGYRETDSIGGKDIYSASKGAAELIVHAYFCTFFNHEQSKVRVASARAGNVIGGGDWAKGRLVVDCVKSWASGKSVNIRSPLSTRPWQHVLEPLSGYLMLGLKLSLDRSLSGESFNFGPRPDQNKSVMQLLNDLAVRWGWAESSAAYTLDENVNLNEAGALRLNCDKASEILEWEACLDYQLLTQFVADWYHGYFEGESAVVLTGVQMNNYFSLARQQKLSWV